MNTMLVLLKLSKYRGAFVNSTYCLLNALKGTLGVWLKRVQY